MKFLVLASIFIFQFSWASEGSSQDRADLIRKKVEGVKNCQNFFHVDDQNIYFGYGFYSNTPGGLHVAKPTNLLVIPLTDKAPLNLKMQDSAIDILPIENRLYILTHTGLEEWDKGTLTFIRRHPTYLRGQQMGWEQHPTQMARYQDKLIMAHGRLGMSVFDLKSKAIVYQSLLAQGRLPLESKVTGVTVLGDKAYFILDSFSILDAHTRPQPFQGVIVMNLKTYAIEAELDGLEPGSDAAFAYEGRLVISMYGIPLLKYDVSRLKGTKLPGPIARISHFPDEGRWLGKPQLDGENVYTCFQVIPEDVHGEIVWRPRVWKRSDLRLTN